MAIFSRKSKKATTEPTSKSTNGLTALPQPRASRHADSDDAANGMVDASRGQNEPTSFLVRDRVTGSKTDDKVSNVPRSIFRTASKSASRPSSSSGRADWPKHASSLSSDLSPPQRPRMPAERHHSTPVMRAGYHDAAPGFINSESKYVESLRVGELRSQARQFTYDPIQGHSAHYSVDSGFRSSEDSPTNVSERTITPSILCNHPSQNGNAAASALTLQPETVSQTQATPQASAEDVEAQNSHVQDLDTSSGRQGADVAQTPGEATSNAMPRLKLTSHSRSQSNPRPELHKRYSSKAAKVLGEEIPFDEYATPPPRRDNDQRRVKFTQTAKGQSKLPANDQGFQFDLEDVTTHPAHRTKNVAGNEGRSTYLTRDEPLSNSTQQPQVSGRKVTIPPLSILEGFRVNKSSRILDEEGEQIGELVEGDILDCVRQKVNAFGEVMDEYGGVVGRARTIPRYHLAPSLSRRGYAPSQDVESRTSSSQDTVADFPRLPPSNVTHTEEVQSSQLKSNEPRSAPFTEPLREDFQSSSDKFTPLVVEKSPEATQNAAQGSPPKAAPNEIAQHQSEYSRENVEETPLTALPILPEPTAMEIPDKAAATGIPPPSAPISSKAVPVVTKQNPSQASTDSIEPIPPQPMPTKSESSTSPFAYKGAIPALDGPTPGTQILPRVVPMDLEKYPSQPPSINVERDPSTVQPVRSGSISSPFAYKGSIPATDGLSPGTKLELMQKVAVRDMQPTSSQLPTDTIEPVPSSSRVLPRSESSPSMFAYKGSIPATDGPMAGTQQHGKLGRLPQSASSQFLSPTMTPQSRALPPFSRSYSNPKLVFAGQQLNNQPFRRSPLTSSASEVSPISSDNGSLQESKSSASSFSQPPQLVTNMASARNMTPPADSRPRTYFTHSGKVTMQAGAQQAKDVPASNAKPEPASVPSGELKKTASKRSRFSLRGRRASAATTK